MKIGNKNVGDGNRVFIIAEASSNHGKDIKRAKKMIDVAAEARADAVKFQLFTAEKISADTDDPRTIVRTPTFVKKPTKLIDLYRENEFPREWLKELALYARAKKILFMATPFDNEAVDLLEAVGAPAHKVASYELLDVPLLRKIASTGKPVIVSTGAATLSEVEYAVDVLTKAGAKDIIILHCSSVYPTPPEHTNLKAMQTMQSVFPEHVIGYSDHTLGIAISITAVALGAKVIEKHFMLDDGVHTVDDKFSLNPSELKQMVSSIRMAEQSLGSSRKAPSVLEKNEKLKARRSLWVIRDIKKGEKLTEKNIASLRPALGLSPMFYDLVMVAKASRHLKKRKPLEWGDILQK
ncbi:MAG: pseudaminic acid synthase [Parcubacteria group bacterium]|nr:pseudaminic acid synthase [Parcubacteria group bacterium]